MKKRILAILLVGLSIFALTGCGEEEKYEKALEAYNSGDYDEAVTMFEELGDYEDAKVYLYDCQQAVIELLIDGGDYDSAQEKATEYAGDSDENNLVEQTEVDIEFDKLKNVCIKKEWMDTSLYEDAINGMADNSVKYEYALEKYCKKGFEYLDHLETGIATKIFSYLKNSNYKNANVYYDFSIDVARIWIDNEFVNLSSEQEENMQEYYDKYNIESAMKVIDGTYEKTAKELNNNRYIG